MVTRSLVVASVAALAVSAMYAQRNPHTEIFATSDQCVACHNGLRTPAGEDVSIGASWRASMMANSSRDPYWQAGVRREMIDHPAAAAEIQDECATCHMPMSRTEARINGRQGGVFNHLPVADKDDRSDRLAHDGVACSICHQITDQNLGTPASFTGGYVVSPSAATASSRARPTGQAHVRPLQDRAGDDDHHEIGDRVRTDRSAARAAVRTVRDMPHADDEGPWARRETSSASCPSRSPFWSGSTARTTAEQRSCQSCHMPVVEQDTPIASVLGAPRKGFARHTFVGGNFFMQRLLNRYRDELGVVATPAEFDAALGATVANLQTSTAELSIERAERSGARLIADVQVRNLTGHKLPTGYPSRRAWLHVAVRDRAGRIVFESGAIAPNGSIAGNDNDADALAVEPHYSEIRAADQVQIYESVMGDASGRPTTGLLTAVRYLKDNRLVPRGFDKSIADPRIAVIGSAAQDADFGDSGDRVRYAIDVDEAAGPFQIDAELRFQVIGFRWAENLKVYKSEETNRFVGYYESMASSSSEVLVARRQVVN